MTTRYERRGVQAALLDAKYGSIPINANGPEYGVVGDGSAGDGSRLQAALNDGAADGRVVSVGGKINYADLGSNGLLLDVNKTGLLSYGATLDFSGVSTSGTGLHIMGSGVSGTDEFGQSQHGISGGCYLKGPGRSRSGWVALLLDGTAAAVNGSGASIDRLNISDAETIFKLGSNSYLPRFYGCEWWNAGWVIDVPSDLSNGGENLSFESCILFTSDNGIRVNNSGTDLSFVNCSLDYISNRFIECVSGQIAWIGGHIEGNSDNDYWFYVAQNTGALLLRPTSIVVAGNKSNYNLGFCRGSDSGDSAVSGNGSTTQVAGLDFSPSYLDIGRAGRTYTLSTLVKGSGRVTTQGFRGYAGAGALPPVSRTLGPLQDETFNSVTNGLKGLALGTIAPTIDTTVGYGTSANSLRFKPTTAGDVPYAKITRPIRPGDIPLLSWRQKRLSIPSGKAMATRVSFLDANGIAIGTPSEYRYQADAPNNGDTGDWELKNPVPQSPAPKGATTLLVEFAGCNDLAANDPSNWSRAGQAAGHILAPSVATAHFGLARYGGTETSGIAVTPGQLVAARAWIYMVQNPSRTRLRIRWYQSSGAASAVTALTEASYLTSTGEALSTILATAPSDAAFCDVCVVGDNVTGAAATIEFYFDAVQILVGAVAVPAYADGDTSGYTWSGTAHASTTIGPNGQVVNQCTNPSLEKNLTNWNLEKNTGDSTTLTRDTGWSTTAATAWFKDLIVNVA
jgi:hypothetical protein